MKQILVALLVLGFVVSAAAIPSHAQAMQDQGSEMSEANETENASKNVERGPVQSSDQPVRRGPPAFVQDIVPAQALENMPDFFW